MFEATKYWWNQEALWKWNIPKLGACARDCLRDQWKEDRKVLYWIEQFSLFQGWRYEYEPTEKGYGRCGWPGSSPQTGYFHSICTIWWMPSKLYGPSTWLCAPWFQVTLDIILLMSSVQNNSFSPNWRRGFCSNQSLLWFVVVQLWYFNSSGENHKYRNVDCLVTVTLKKTISPWSSGRRLEKCLLNSAKMTRK